MQIGFDTFIIADPALILYLREQKISCNIHLSGECAEINSLFLAQIAEFDIRRVIFHRKNSIAQMRACIVKCRGEIPEYEAFFLNEMCHFTGAYCNSFHCDEFAHLCHVPYELGNIDGRKKSSLAAAEERSGLCVETEPDGYVTGATGCGLCALYDLKKAGVTHLKIVGRGNYAEYAKRDIMQARRAIRVPCGSRKHGNRAGSAVSKAGTDRTFPGRMYEKLLLFIDTDGRKRGTDALRIHNGKLCGCGGKGSSIYAFNGKEKKNNDRNAERHPLSCEDL